MASGVPVWVSVKEPTPVPGVTVNLYTGFAKFVELAVKSISLPVPLCAGFRPFSSYIILKSSEVIFTVLPEIPSDPAVTLEITPVPVIDRVLLNFSAASIVTLSDTPES